MIEPEGAISPIITKSAKEIIQSGHYNNVPCIFGYNADEGLLTNVDDLIDSQNGWDFAAFLPFQMNICQESDLAKVLGQKLKDKFTANGVDLKTALHRVSEME